MEYEKIESIFGESFQMKVWKDLMKSLFKNFDEYRTPVNRLEKGLTFHEKAQAINEFGSVMLADNKIIKLYEIILKNDYDISKSRVGLRNMIFRDIVPGDMDGIIAVFRTEKSETWRLTFISKAIYWDDDFNEQKLQTSPRRYTYVLGKDESVKTAVRQFESLFGKQITIKQLIEAFNVDKLNKLFFNDYQKHYEKFVLFLTGEIWKKKQNKFELTKVQEPSPLLQSAFYGNTKNARDFCKKLLGRLVFLHFLQKKGWLGCSPDLAGWENGEKQFMILLLEGYGSKETFHSKCLTELFFNTLNKPNRDNVFQVDGLIGALNGSKVPYLNGGLFETDVNCDPYKVDFPVSYFEELLDFFGQYNFTIDENSPDDHEVGIDPEMLGHIFENLLEENKEKGAFYTPKEIVQYMAQESLIQYLQTHLGNHQEITNFIRNNDIGDRFAKQNFIRDNAAKIEDLLDNVKICDPAIGSGAFPMGMLVEIFEAKMALDMTLNRSEVKKKIIQNSIYGVDLESGAVDIARLRFWLALVVDEDEPHALPNLDYKIMQGNSLLESFEGIPLDGIHEGKQMMIEDKFGDNLFSKVISIEESQENEKLQDIIQAYFNLDDPEEKKIQHRKIDEQVLGNIYKCLDDEYKLLEDDYKSALKKIKEKLKDLTSAEQKLKYETDSKDSKNAKSIYSKLQSIAEKQLRLKELYESNDRPFFLWHLLFREIIIDKGGFDIVIGNPPYINANDLKKTLGSEKYEELKSYYTVAKGPIDIYILFYQLGMKILKQKGGILTYINPNRYLSASYATALRDFIYRKSDILCLADYSSLKLFKEASTYPVVTTLRMNNSIQTTNITVRKMTGRLEVLESQLAPSDLSFLPGNIWGYLLNDKISVVKRIIKDCVSIDAVGKINATSTAKESDEYHHLINQSEKGLKLINTGIIDRYSTKWGVEKLTDKGERYDTPYLDCENEVVSNNRKKLYSKPKIIIAKIAIRAEAFYDRDGSYASINTNCIHTFKDDFVPEYVTCWINSKLYQYIYEAFFDGLRMGGGFLLYSAPNILKTYIRKLDRNVQEFFVPLECALSILGSQITKNDMYEVIYQSFDEIVDAVIFEAYFPDEFEKANVKIMANAIGLFPSMDSLTDKEKEDTIINVFNIYKEKNNPLRNQIKLMKIELKHLLLPILSI